MDNILNFREATMPVKYIVVPHKIPSKPADPVTYYPRLKASGEVGLRELVNDIALASTLSQADMLAAIESLLQHIPRYLAEGKIVRLGELGSFSLGIQAEGAPTAAAVNASKIKRNKLRFRAGKLMVKLLQDVTYRKE
jgi:predicted histone-like DNA-binding protein